MSSLHSNPDRSLKHVLHVYTMIHMLHCESSRCWCSAAQWIFLQVLEEPAAKSTHCKCCCATAVTHVRTCTVLFTSKPPLYYGFFPGPSERLIIILIVNFVVLFCWFTVSGMVYCLFVLEFVGSSLLFASWWSAVIVVSFAFVCVLFWRAEWHVSRACLQHLLFVWRYIFGLIMQCTPFF